jgi:predicted nucleotidyltransferase
MLYDISWLVAIGLVAWSAYQSFRNKVLQEAMKQCLADAKAWSIVRIAAIPIEEVPVGEYSIKMVGENFGSTYFLFRYRGNR